jgi:hypothetical protein
MIADTVIREWVLVHSIWEYSMATRGQHFIPRFLLNGFASRSRGDEHHTWLFRIGSKAMEVNTKNIAKERDFHGNPNISSLEDSMQSREGVYAPVIARLRENEITGPDLQVAAEFVINLSVRTKNLRHSIVEMAGNTIDAMREHATDKKIQRELKQKTKKELRQKLRELPEWEMIQRLPARQRKLWLRIGEAKIERDIVPMMDLALQEMRAKADLIALAERTQKNVLNKTLAPEIRIEQIKQLNWFRMVSDQPLIMGDAACVGMIGGEYVHPLKADKDAPLEGLYLPISTTIALLATQQTTPPEFEADQWNIAQARLSREFFISGCKGENEYKYFALLGSKSGFYSVTDIVEKLRE